LSQETKTFPNTGRATDFAVILSIITKPFLKLLCNTFVFIVIGCIAEVSRAVYF